MSVCMYVCVCVSIQFVCPMEITWATAAVVVSGQIAARAVKVKCNSIHLPAHSVERYSFKCTLALSFSHSFPHPPKV